MIPPYWEKAINYLQNQDYTLAKILQSYPDASLKNLNNPFQTLIRAVVGQQISVTAADAVWGRLMERLPQVSPVDFLNLSESELKECGLSRQKIAYMGNIADSFEEGILTPKRWESMTDTEVTKQLLQIKGVGQWTAEMFLIFHLHRADVFPMADLGLINAVRQHYGDLSKVEILALSKRWQPYRTVATWYLWRSLDPVVVQY